MKWGAQIQVVLLAISIGALAQPATRTSPSSLPLFARNGSRAGTGTGPYRPSGIVDPFSDINCEEEACSAENPCSDWPYRVCEAYDNCSNKVCLHKQLWPMLQHDLWLFVMMFGIAVAAGAAGIGGGGLNVPILMMVSAFGIKEAVPLSHAAVMGNAFAQLLVNAPQRHPSSPTRPLIHYELAILALPAQLGGNSLGVVIGRIFPPTLLIILSLAMLALAATKTFIKAVEVHHAFRCQKPTAPAALPESGPQGTFSLPGVNPALSVKDGMVKNTPIASHDIENLRTWSGTNLLPHRQVEQLMAAVSQSSQSNNVTRSARAYTSAGQPFSPEGEQHMRIPWKVISCMIAFNVIFCIDFLGMSPDVFGVEKCSIPYWFVFLGLYPFVAGSIWVGIQSLRNLAEYHRRRGDDAIPGDPVVSARLIVLFPLAAVLIGLIAGLVGLGGGEFMVPLLLEFGLVPRVASATSGFLILFATSSNIVHYGIADIMQPFFQYAMFVFVLAFFGALMGLKIRDTKFMRTHSYLLVFLLAGLLTVSGGLLAYRGFVSSSLDWGFKPFCGGSGE